MVTIHIFFAEKNYSIFLKALHVHITVENGEPRSISFDCIFSFAKSKK